MNPACDPPGAVQVVVSVASVVVGCVVGGFLVRGLAVLFFEPEEWAGRLARLAPIALRRLRSRGAQRTVEWSQQRCLVCNKRHMVVPYSCVSPSTLMERGTTTCVVCQKEIRRKRPSWWVDSERCLLREGETAADHESRLRAMLAEKFE